VDKEKFIKNIKEFLKETLDTLVFVIVAVILIRFLIGELRWIPSGSMHPTLIEKDRLFVEKVTKPFRAPERGDVIVFYPPEVTLKHDVLSTLARLTGIFCRDIAYIKRIIGMPGDKFEIKKEKDGNFYVFINDIPLDEPYILSKTDWTPCSDAMYCGPFVLGENEYFMMGDNRGNSQDSRFWGTLKKDRIIGRALFTFWPLNRIEMLNKY